MTPKPLKHVMDARHEARKIVLQALFANSFLPADLAQMAKHIKEEMMPTVCDEELLGKLLDGVQKDQAKIDQLISRCAPEWPLAQLPKVDLNILRIAIYELYVAKSVPPKVAIDEAVELAKEFSGDSASSFVNGALGTIIKLQNKQSDIGTALFLGSFQPFHKGHLRALKQIAQRFPQIIIGIKDAKDFKDTRDGDNPISYEENRELLDDVLDSASFELDQRVEGEEVHPEFKVVPIPPVNGEGKWVEQVLNICPSFAVVYTNDEGIAALFQDANFPVFRTQMVKPDEYNSIEIRRRIALGGSWHLLVPRKVERFLKSRKIDKRIISSYIGAK